MRRDCGARRPPFTLASGRILELGMRLTGDAACVLLASAHQAKNPEQVNWRQSFPVHALYRIQLQRAGGSMEGLAQ